MQITLIRQCVIAVAGISQRTGTEAVLVCPVVLCTSAPLPMAVFELPVVFPLMVTYHSCVVIACGVVKERETAVGRVLYTLGVVKERVSAGGGVVYAGGIDNRASKPMAVLLLPVGVEFERAVTDCRVEVAGGVELKGFTTDGRVPREIGRGDTVLERAPTDGCVKAAGGVKCQRTNADGRVAFALRIAEKSEHSIGRVVDAGRVSFKGSHSNGCVIAARVQ